jgi:hypothetical protein
MQVEEFYNAKNPYFTVDFVNISDIIKTNRTYVRYIVAVIMMSEWQLQLKTYSTWLHFKKNKEFYHHFSSLFLFYAYESPDTIQKQLEGFNYLTESGQIMFKSMIYYMISIGILVPIEVYDNNLMNNFYFRCTVTATPKQIQEAF